MGDLTDDDAAALARALELAPGAAVITATEGVTASFMRELVRRAVLRALADDPAAEVALTTELLDATVAELGEERSSLTRALLGGAAPPG